MKTITPHQRIFRNLASLVIAAVVLAACGGEAVPLSTTTSVSSLSSTTVGGEGDVTTTAPPTTTVDPTTTSTLGTTTTTTPVADPVEVEVLREQSHEVVMGYLTRMADLHSPNFQGVSPSDRFEGPLVAAMIAQAAYNDYMLACVSAGLCERGQGLIGGQVEALAPAGSEVILPYGDGTYYVSGVYANSRTRVFAAGYLGGFRFRVDDGQAVLIDAVVWPWQTVDGSGGEDVRGMWMSERSFPGTAAASRVKVTSHNPNMTFGPALTFVPVTATRAKDFVLVFEATNNGSSEIVPLPTEGVDSILRRVPPGETRTEIYRGFYDASQMGGTFSFEISDAVGGNGRLATVEVSLPNARNCASTDEVEPAVIREGDCIRPSAIARARGFINHTN